MLSVNVGVTRCELDHTTDARYCITFLERRVEQLRCIHFHHVLALTAQRVGRTGVETDVWLVDDRIIIRRDRAKFVFKYVEVLAQAVVLISESSSTLPSTSRSTSNFIQSISVIGLIGTVMLIESMYIAEVSGCTANGSFHQEVSGGSLTRIESRMAADIHVLHIHFETAIGHRNDVRVKLHQLVFDHVIRFCVRIDPKRRVAMQVHFFEGYGWGSLEVPGFPPRARRVASSGYRSYCRTCRGQKLL